MCLRLVIGEMDQETLLRSGRTRPTEVFRALLRLLPILSFVRHEWTHLAGGRI
jgi:uncharacterized heparinase superfamily protein